MAFWELLTAPETRPFAVAIGLVLGLLLMEMAALLLGGTLLGADADAPDASGFDLDGPDFDAPDLDAAEFELAQLDAADLDAPDTGQTAAAGGASGLIGWLGVGEAPFLVWLTAFLTAFGVAGFALQVVADDGFGVRAPVLWASLAALPIGLAAAKTLSRAIARALPKVQSSAVSRRRLGGRVGVVTGAVGRRGRPTEARIQDWRGHTHYIRVEPLEDDAELAPGAEIVVLRARRGDAEGLFRALPLDDARARIDARAS